MSPLHLPRWTAPLLLSLLAGVLLVTHGLEASAATEGTRGASGASLVQPRPGETPADHHEAGCEGCVVSHVMAACVAILATVAGLRLARRATAGSRSTLVGAAAGRLLAARRLVRPPEPVWIRLAVMRC